MARTIITLATLAATLTLAMSPVAAVARDRGDDRGYDRSDDRQWRGDDDRRDWRDRVDYRYDRRGDRRAYRYQQQYYNQGYGQGYGRGYGQGHDRRNYYADTRYAPAYYDNRGQYRCRGNGTAGTIIGAIAGGLLGNSVAGRGDKTLGTVIGGGVGAVAGRAIDRSDDRC